MSNAVMRVNIQAQTTYNKWKIIMKVMMYIWRLNAQIERVCGRRGQAKIG